MGVGGKFVALGGLASGIFSQVEQKQRLEREEQDKNRAALVGSLTDWLKSGTLDEANADRAVQILFDLTLNKGAGIKSGQFKPLPEPVGRLVTAIGQSEQLGNLLGGPGGAATIGGDVDIPGMAKTPAATPAAAPAARFGTAGLPAPAPTTTPAQPYTRPEPAYPLTQRFAPGDPSGLSQPYSWMPRPMTRAQQLERGIAEATAIEQAKITAANNAKRALAEQYMRDDPTMTRTAAYRAAGLMQPAEPSLISRGVSVPGKSIPPGAKDVTGMPLVTEEGQWYQPYSYGAEMRYGPGRPPSASLGAALGSYTGEFRQRLEMIAGQKGWDPNSLTPEQARVVINQAGVEAAADRDLDRRSKEALIEQRNNAANKAAGLQEVTILPKEWIATLRAALGRTGDDAPVVRLGVDGRPDAVEQQKFLSVLPADVQALVKNFAEYDIAPSTFSTRTTRSGSQLTREQMVALTQMYSAGTYSEADFPVRQGVKRSWASGPAQVQMQAANTLVGHLGRLWRAASVLAPYTRTRWPVLNMATMNLAAQKGERPIRELPNGKLEYATDFPTIREAMAQFRTAANAVSDEATRVFAGVQGAEAERERWLSLLDVYAATDAKKASLRTLVDLMFSRISSAARMYRATMGVNPPAGQALQAKSLDVLVKTLGMSLTDPDLDVDSGLLPSGAVNPFGR